MKKATFISFLILILLLRMEVSAQSSESQNVSKAIDALVVAMITSDEAMLNGILSDALQYGHSSGLIQDKSGFVKEVISKSPMIYNSIEREKEKIQVNKKTATVTHILVIKGKNPAGEIINLRIGNMMVWEKEKSGWKLLARQAYKLS